MCRTWQQHLSQPGPLWAAVVLSRPDGWDQHVQLSPRRAQSLECWFMRIGMCVRQLQSSMAANVTVRAPEV